ncbi:MAG: transposase [Patescibacteria group bacterium]|mgnify:CR=1 FL=1
MGKKLHRTPLEVKTDIIRRIKEEGIPVAQAAKEHGIHEGTIYGWISAGSQGTPSWSEFAKLQKQNRELLALVGEITLQLSTSQKKN